MLISKDLQIKKRNSTCAGLTKLRKKKLNNKPPFQFLINPASLLIINGQPHVRAISTSFFYYHISNSHAYQISSGRDGKALGYQFKKKVPAAALMD